MIVVIVVTKKTKNDFFLRKSRFNQKAGKWVEPQEWRGDFSPLCRARWHSHKPRFA